MLIKTLQWNIGGGKIRPVYADPNDFYGYTDDGIDHIVNIINQYLPDIITLQEVHSDESLNQVEYVAKQTNYKYCFNNILDESFLEKGKKWGIGTISKFPIENKNFEFFNNPKWTGLGPKGENWVSFNFGVSSSIINLNNLKLEIKNVHLVPFHRFNKNPLSEESRLIRDDVVDKLKTTNNTFLIQGDFNYDDVSIKNFLPQVFTEGVFEVPLNFPTSPKGKRYDHIIYSGLKFLKTEIIQNVLTDHFAIYSEFEIG